MSNDTPKNQLSYDPIPEIVAPNPPYDPSYGNPLLLKILELCEHASTRVLDDAELLSFNALSTELQGYDHIAGLRYTTIGPEAVIGELAVCAHHLQPAGLVHGGIYSGIAESCASIASMCHAHGRTVVGVNNNMDFLRATRAGVLTVEACPLKVGRRTHVIDISIRHRGELMAHGTLRTYVMGPESA